MEKKSCTIITTHSPKFNYAIKLLDSFDKFVQKPHDIYFVFTNDYEETIFRNNFGSRNYYSIILPIDLQNKLSIVNNKKFYAIDLLIDKYDYFGVYDCESEFVRPCNLSQIYEQIGKRDYIKANVSTIGSTILDKLARILKLEKNETLLRETENLTLYWWFNEIPVFRKDYFIEFFEWLKGLENYNEIQNEYYCFDYLMYGIWMVVYKDVKIKKIETSIISEIGALEDFRLPTNVRDEITEKLESYWSTNINSYQCISKIKLLFHTDSIGSFSRLQ